MQFAEIAVKTKVGKIDQTFSYSIPPSMLADIKKGVLVEIPFHGRKLPGVVLDLKRNANLKFQLKPISKIICTSPILDNVQLKLADWISNYYLATIGEVIFSMIPPIAKRSMKKLSWKAQDIKISNNKPIIYTLYDRADNRIKDYFKLIDKALKSNKQILIAFPVIDTGSDLINKFQEYFKSQKICILSSTLSSSQRFKNWLDIKLNKCKIIIGSRSSILAPFNNLGLIIVDQPENFAYKEEQSPRYHTVAVARKLSELSGALIVLGSSSPDVENFYFENRGMYKKIKNQKSKIKNIKIDLIDMRQEKNIISWKLEQEIGEILQKKGKVLLFVSRRGSGSAFLCQDCGNIFRCPRCSNALTYHDINPPSLVCHHCNYNSSLPLTCPNCRGANLKSLGYGTEVIENKISKMFPRAKIILVDKNTAKKTETKNYDMVIATKSILQTNQLFDLTAVVSIDYGLNLPDIYSSEKTYFTIVDLIDITDKRLVIQTHQPDNHLLYLLASNRMDQFLKRELDQRKQYNYPPFGILIKIIYKSGDAAEAQKELLRLYNLFKNRVKEEKLKVEISQPSPCYLSRKRDKYYQQIIIKSKDSKVKNVIKNMIIPKNLVIDVDPISLL